jgi:hypothetical protein
MSCISQEGLWSEAPPEPKVICIPAQGTE